MIVSIALHGSERSVTRALNVALRACKAPINSACRRTPVAISKQKRAQAPSNRNAVVAKPSSTGTTGIQTKEKTKCPRSFAMQFSPLLLSPAWRARLMLSRRPSIRAATMTITTACAWAPTTAATMMAAEAIAANRQVALKKASPASRWRGLFAFEGARRMELLWLPQTPETRAEIPAVGAMCTRSA